MTLALACVRTREGPQSFMHRYSTDPGASYRLLEIGDTQSETLNIAKLTNCTNNTNNTSCTKNGNYIDKNIRRINSVRKEN